jgi:hypothetical protein
VVMVVVVVVESCCSSGSLAPHMPEPNRVDFMRRLISIPRRGVTRKFERHLVHQLGERQVQLLG